jgi:flagellar M-ring protein FliF
MVTASVNLTTTGGARLSNQQVANIRSAMLGAIAGLKPQNVRITDQADHHYPTGTDDLASASEDAYFLRTQAYEQELESKVLAALERIRGVQVQASVELNPEMRYQQEKRNVDPKAVTISQSESNRTSNTTGAAPQGPPGVRAQQPNQPAAVGAAAAPRTDSEESQTEKQSVVSTDTTLRDLAPMTPRDAKVTVTVPSSYYVEVWRDQNKPAAGQPAKEPTAADLQRVRTDVKSNIENAVNTLLPNYPPGQDPYPRVTVVEFQDLAPVAAPAPAFTEHFLAWLGQSWTTLGLLLLGLVSLLMLRAMIRATPVEETLGRVLPATLSLAPAPAAEEHPAEAKPRLKRRSAPGTNLRDELAEIVREDPDSAATILRSWIGNAG